MGRGKWVEKSPEKSPQKMPQHRVDHDVQSTALGQSTFATQMDTTTTFANPLPATTRFLQYISIVLLLAVCHLAMISSMQYAKLSNTLQQVTEKTTQFIHEENRTLADTVDLIKTPLPLLISLGYILSVVCLLGIWGIATVQTRCVKYYAVLSITFLIAVAPPFLIASFATWARLGEEVEMLYKAYVGHFYGTIYKHAYFDNLVDKLQSSYSCCGFDAQPKLGAYYHVIHYSENTNWGILQGAKAKWNQEAVVPLTPESCCRKQESGCSSDTYKNRFDGSKENIKKWNEIIHVNGCKGNIVKGFSSMAFRMELLSALVLQINARVKEQDDNEGSIMCNGENAASHLESKEPFPWNAVISLKVINHVICLGSIIPDRPYNYSFAILTSGKCFSWKILDKLASFVLQVHFQTDKVGPFISSGMRSRIRKITFVNKERVISTRLTRPAILLLKRPVVFNDKAFAICTAWSSLKLQDDQLCYTSIYKEGKIIAKPMKIVTKDHCEKEDITLKRESGFCVTHEEQSHELVTNGKGPNAVTELTYSSWELHWYALNLEKHTKWDCTSTH
ncbi:Tetraspannin domain containing protein [Trichuris trichiura]|uniref:Tetraspannin domain containing protein n=1 Tax=Trichuris trichiura TaxID=36087 RepID=A0A077Z3D0_TRITR|nr:Tetraspannin domain containing protein [Trichuris trichiura]